MDNAKLEALCYNVAQKAIKAIGIENFKKTSLFASNQHKEVERKAAA